ncbi:MFS transporter [Streptomyces sp. NPDC021093]|uniref:MFS transporter n=1 Tax=Streptomyces sp. NPDC021093 TaxID=3365112 RepID=UPI003796658A
MEPTRREPFLDVTLHAGDSLYLPRGFIHAPTTQDSHSIHITLGAEPVTWEHLLREILKDSLSQQQIFREAVPPEFGSLTPGQLSALAGSILEALSEEIVKPKSNRKRREIRSEISEGMRFVLRSRLLRSLTLSNCIISSSLAMISSIWILYVVRDLQWSSTASGIVLGVGSAGSLVGSFFIKWSVERFGAFRIMLVSVAFYGPCELTTVMVGRGAMGQVLVGLSFFLLTVCAIVNNTVQRTLRQALCPPELLGRMNASVRWLQWTLTPLGALGGGWVGSHLGLQNAILCGSSGLIVAAVLLFLSPLRTENSLLRPGPELATAQETS